MLERERLDRDRFEGVVNEAILQAESKLKDKPGEAGRWRRAIEKAFAYLTTPAVVWYLSEQDELLIVSPQSSALYEVGERSCDVLDAVTMETRGECAAAHKGVPCWHRAAWKLLRNYCAEPLECEPSPLPAAAPVLESAAVN